MFGAGLDGRKASEFVFINDNIQEFNHGVRKIQPDVHPSVSDMPTFLFLERVCMYSLTDSQTFLS